MRTFGFGKEAHGVDGHHLYRGQKEKENKVWERGKDRGRHLNWGAPDK